MPRFRSKAAFWDITFVGTTLAITTGARGEPGTTSVERFDSAAQARRAYVDRVRAQTFGPARFDPLPAEAVASTRRFVRGTETWDVTLDGLRVAERSGTGEPSVREHADRAAARATYNDRLRAQLAAGYVERGAHNPELERAIEDDPDDPAAYSVLADCLQSHGDPRGELIALQLAGQDLEAAARLAADRARFLGPLAEHELCYDHLYHRPVPPAFEWRHGFIQTARMSYNAIWEEAFKGPICDVLELLLRHPSGRFLVELVLMYNGDPSEDDLQSLIDCLVRLAPPTLRRLVIGDEVDQISWYHVGDLGAVWAAAPRLRELEIEAGTFALGTIEAPELRRAIFKTGGLSADSGDAIAHAVVPAIEQLEIYFGDPEYGATCGMQPVHVLLDRTDLPHLHHLGLEDAVFADEICAALPGSKLLRQLRSLDLSQGIMTDAGAQILLDHADAFAHLDVLNLEHNYLSAGMVTKLRGLAKRVIVDDQKDDEGDVELRYVTVGE
ncbi:MAG TPA: TIGR02996 domain-containing protein [Kofleriaceae bacterium]|nr:TIGR02996 domain-containing protein [Kofleriaceae bacterium]